MQERQLSQNQLEQKVEEKDPLKSFLKDLYSLENSLDIESLENDINHAYEGKLRRSLLAIVTSYETRKLRTELAPIRTCEDEIREFLSSTPVTQIVQVMLKDEEKYKFQLGVILPLVDIAQFNSPVIDNLKKDNSRLRLLIHGPQDWFLCETADGNMEVALEQKAAVIVNKKIIVKLNGKKTGFCIESFKSETGAVFLKGNFYSPLDPDTKHSIRTSFDEGRKHINLDKGNWTLMRRLKPSLRRSVSNIIEEAQTYTHDNVNKLPEIIEGKTRTQWRTKKAESD